MKTFHHSTLALVLLASACSRGGSDSPNVSNVPTLEITATHAIDIKQPAKAISFVPNNVAPWLGRIILNNEASGLASTDIEGRTAQRVLDQSVVQTFGLARENASGVFLTIKDDIQAYMESDDQGNFAPLSYSGNKLRTRAFCATDTGNENSVPVITADGDLKTISLAIEKTVDAGAAPVEQKQVSSLPAPDQSTMCAVTNNQTIAYSKSGQKAFLHSYANEKWTKNAASPNIEAMAYISLNDAPYLLLLDKGDAFLYDVTDSEIKSRLVVKSGLSIAGLDKVKFIATTTHNFGGAAFSDGLIAFGQADADRIVFVSRSYLEDVLRTTE